MRLFQNLILERHAFGIVLLEPLLRGIKVTRLTEKLTKLKEEMGKLAAYEKQMGRGFSWRSTNDCRAVAISVIGRLQRRRIPWQYPPGRLAPSIWRD